MNAANMNISDEDKKLTDAAFEQLIGVNLVTITGI